MPLISTQPGDIVVIVPRWLIAAVGLLMLLMGLTVSFIFLLAGFAPASLFVTLFVLVIVPLQLLLLYIVWRFYWYFLIIGILMQGIMFMVVMVGSARMGVASPFANDPSIAVVFPSGDSFAFLVLVSFLMAFAVVMMVALVLRSFLGSPLPSRRMDYDVDDLDRPRPKRIIRRDDRPYPPPNDPYWDDK